MPKNPLEIQNDPKLLDPRVQSCFNELAKKFKFKYVETLRSVERQKQLVKDGKSWTMKSNHLKGFASDLFPLPDGYKSKPQVWQDMHCEWDRICKERNFKYEPRIGKDLGHFGVFL